MKELVVIARMTINPGHEEAYRKLGQDCVNLVRQHDKGTLQYEWFYQAGSSTSVVLERYIDSDAFLQHMGNVGEPLGQMLAMSSLKLEVYGNPSESLTSAIKDFDVTYYTFEYSK